MIYRTWQSLARNFFFKKWPLLRGRLFFSTRSGAKPRPWCNRVEPQLDICGRTRWDTQLWVSNRIFPIFLRFFTKNAYAEYLKIFQNFFVRLIFDSLSYSNVKKFDYGTSCIRELVAINPRGKHLFFPFHTWFDFPFLLSKMEIINKFDKTSVNILNVRRESFFVKDHMSL